MKPLFADDPHDEPSGVPAPGHQNYLLPRSDPRRVDPPAHHDAEAGESGGEINPAVELIRRKIDSLYVAEPSAAAEAQEAAAAPQPRSKHQQFMYELQRSGRPLADIQTAWHNYYVQLPDEEKHEVWREFYAASSNQPSAYTHYVQQQASTPVAMPPTPAHYETAKPRVIVSEHETPATAPPKPDRRSVATIKKHIKHRVQAAASSHRKATQHLQSLLFGLGLAGLVVLIFLFGFFNEVVIAPFIQPGSHATATPIILSADSVAPTPNPEVIIPKINVEIPIVYGSSINEEDIQNSLEDGVIHYPTTAQPGQQGNAAFFGHSSNNIFNKGRYKFAFVLLHELEPGDIFYLTYGGKVYTYKIFSKKIVEPGDTWVLDPVAGKAATATLITCDPPGTSLHRMVVWGEQISPDPAGNSAAATVPSAAAHAAPIPGNGPTLWSRFWRWATHW